jgi:surfactin synthase thioesterase subunit
MHQLPRERLLGGLRQLGVRLDETGTTERALRGECAAMASYVFVREAPLEIPITAFIGDRDSFVPTGGVQAWRAQTTATFAFHACRGTHDLPGEDSSLRQVVREVLSKPPFAG